MPIPKPKSGEDKNAYVSRCVKTLSDNGDYKDQKQRLAVCYSQIENKEMKEKHLPYVYIPILEDTPIGEGRILESGDVIKILPKDKHHDT